MKDSYDKQKYLEILEKFNAAIEADIWHGVFLQAVKKRLIELMENFKAEMGSLAEDYDPSLELRSRALITQLAEKNGWREVYILLYNVDGSQITKWEQLLNAIEAQAINRPTYEKEEYAKAALRAAPNKYNEAYVAIYVKPEDIIHKEHLKDRFGQPLIQLKDAAIKKSYISNFFHKTGFYEFDKDKLIWQRMFDASH